MNWFCRKKPIDPLKTVDEIYAQVESKFNQRLTQLQQTEKSLRSELDTLQKNHGELVTKLREQTEADILLLVKRIERDILADKKVTQMDMNQLTILRNQQQALAAQSAFGYTYGANSGLLGALGRAAREDK